MKVSDVISAARSCELSNLSATSFTDSRLIQFINLGIIELSKRFRISTKAEAIRTSPYTQMYTLRNSDVISIISIYDSNGKELILQTMTDDKCYDYKLISHNTFLLNYMGQYEDSITRNSYTDIENMQSTESPDLELMVVYSAIADTVSSVDDDLTIPLVFLDPLVAYVGYKASFSLSLDGQGESASSYSKYETSCRLIENSSYNGNEVVLSHSIQSRGFI